MTTGNRTSVWIAAGLALIAAACSSSSSSGDDTIGVEGIVQDLGLDPDGLTIVIEFEKSPGSIAPGNLRADGGQSALLVTRAGATYTVTWDARVTPSHRIRVVNKDDVPDRWRSVATSDTTPPTFTMGVAVQDTTDPLLGGDEIVVTFDGPRVVEALAEDLANWQLSVNATVLDLTGSTFDLDVVTQVMTVTLGPGANLHSAFTLAAVGVTSVADVALDVTPLAGTAAGDPDPPAFVAIEQNLAADEFGTVVDFVFDEPMDPVFSTSIASFSVNDGPGAVGTTLVTGVTMPDDVTLQVSFSKPVVPGFDTVSHTGLVDAHGNALTPGTVGVGNAGAQPNAYDSVVGTTVANAGNDTITIVTDQAFDPDFAVLPGSWSIDVDGGAIVMADQTLSYDLLAKTLLVELDFDMRNGDTIDVTGLGVQEVDGEAFNTTAVTVMADGDMDPPAALSVTQNRTVDPTGTTVDVAFDEDVHPTTATDTANYTFTPAVTIVSATLLAGGDTVRLDTNSVVTPDDFMLTVEAPVDDLAGNPLGASQGPLAIVSTDNDPPTVTGVTGYAIAGADNDTVVVSFDDELVQTEVSDPDNWIFESPAGTPFPLTAPTIRWDRAARTATLVLDEGGQALHTGDDVQVSFIGIRDIGGNAIGPDPSGGPVQAESDLPSVHTVWRHDAPASGTVVVRFTEPCGRLDDLYDAGTNSLGTRYAVRMNDPSRTLRGYPSSATVLDGGLGVELSYLFTVDFTDTLDVIGATDLAGNVLFPVLEQPILAADTTIPDHAAPAVVNAVAGEGNDVITIQFNTPMSPWRIDDPASYRVETNPGGQAVDVSTAKFDWNGTDTLTITLAGTNADNVDATSTYDVTLRSNPDPLRSAQGTPLTAASTSNVGVIGDTTNGPTLAGSRAVISSAIGDEVVFFVFDEAVDEAAVEASIANWVYDGAILPTGGLELISPRVVRLDFQATVTPGFDVEVMQPATLDLAGNDSGSSLVVAVQDDTSGPLLSSVSGTIGIGFGRDRVTVGFSEQVDLASGLDVNNYTVTNGVALDINGSGLTWDSTSETVTIALAAGVELDAGSGLTVQVSGVRDAAGNPIPGTATLGGLVSGDVDPPEFTSVWTNYQLDPAGTTVEVLFDEDVDGAFLAVGLGNWSTSGAALVTAVDSVSMRHVQVGLSAPLAPGDLLELAAGLHDLAQNAAGVLSAEPVDPAD